MGTAEVVVDLYKIVSGRVSMGKICMPWRVKVMDCSSFSSSSVSVNCRCCAVDDGRAIAVDISQDSFEQLRLI